MQYVAPPQYSPDGRWWWNGRVWTRVTWPVPTWRETGDDYEFAEERRRRTPGVLWIGLIALLLLLVLAFGASALTWVTQQGLRAGLPAAPVPVAPAPAVPAAPGPTADPGSGAGSVDAYRAVVASGVDRFQAAGQAVANRCAPAALGQGTGDCRAALESLDSAVQRFQSDLVGTHVPACTGSADRELRTALALYNQGIQQELQGVDGQDLVAIAQGAGTLRDATSHAESAGSLLQTSC